MFKVKVDMGNIEKKVGKAFDKGQFYLDETALKDTNFFVPADTWALRDSSLLHSKIGKGELAWMTPYARRLYYNPHYNFSTDKNPNARGLWWEESKAQNLKNWLDGTEKVVRGEF